MNALNSTVDPVPPSAYPSFQPVTTPQPSMPAVWAATVLLHPYSPALIDRSDARQSVLPALRRQHRLLAGGVFLRAGLRLLLQKLVVLYYSHWNATLDRWRKHLEVGQIVRAHV